MEPRPEAALVFGTYQRLPVLQRAVRSFREAFGSVSYVMIVVDGGSRDGTVEWLKEQPDVEHVAGDLSGAVPNFNLGFARAVDLGCPWVGTQNDDNEALCPPPIFERAIEVLRAEPKVGGVAMEMNTRKVWQCERWAGIPYANTGWFRREAGMAVARMLGDPSGKAWWDRRFKTYAADTIFGVCVNILGFEMRAGVGLRVKDYSHPDEMHRRNVLLYQQDGTANLFSAQFGTAAKCAYSREAAQKFGGLVR